MLDESQWWPREQLVAWQRQHLRPLLTHARSSSPYYRYRLNRVFRPSGEIDWDRWHEIPIVTREDVLKNYKTMLSTAPIPGHGPFQDVQSSGSTGHPVTVRTTRWLMEMGTASNWRAHQWANLDWSRTLVSTQARDERYTEGDDLGTWGPPWNPTSRRGRNLYTHYSTDQDLLLRLIGDEKATYHATSAFSAEMSAEYAIENGADVQLEAILTRGGAVTERLRETVRQAFGARVVEFYSSKEAGAIAQPCPTGSGLHVNSESLFFEVVDESGMPVAPGKSGRAIVTPFGSTALPLIRYDQGDIVVAGDACSCGRCLSLIASISGRERSFLRHPDGRQAAPDMPYEIYQWIGAARVQLAQVGPTNFEVRYTRRDWNMPRNEPAFIKAFRELFFDDANLTFVEMEDIPMSPSGKFLAAIVEWDGKSS
jgi:phenylacetate-coenzyme A ligase PaaK-like adenylate-forming protein